MAQKRRRSRLVLGLAAAIVVAVVLAAAFWPRPRLVDMAPVRQGEMIVTVDETARTRVHEPYVVSAPVAGELQRVRVEPGDRVVGGETVVARMQPARPAALDLRTREQARAEVTAAEAALRVAEADLNAAIARRDYAAGELQRIRQLVEREISSKAALEQAEQEARVAQATVETAMAAIEMRRAEVRNARAQLIGFDDAGLARALLRDEPAEVTIPLKAPVDGTVLQVFRKSETTLPAGEAILEIGDVGTGLEVLAELLSSDAVQVTPGDRVMILGWGGAGILTGKVRRVEPYGFTKVSALGVEEQRVRTTIAFDDPAAAGRRLGDGYRVEVRIVVWDRPDAVMVPSSALFRHGEDWAVFRVEDGRARLQTVRVGRNNGHQAEVLDGLSPGQSVVLFPAAGLADGARVAQRVAE